MRRWRFALSTTVVCTLSFLSCGKSGSSDDSLANDIKAKLFSDQTTKSANINVAVKDGVVTLSGDVPSADVALEAMRVANGTSGIRSVSDQLTINGASAANQLPNAETDTGSTQNTSTASSPYSTQTPPPPSASAEAPPPSANAAAVPPATEPAPPRPVEIPAGTEVSVRTINPIDSKADQEGQTFRSTLTAPLRAHGRVIIPAGADATLELVSSQSSGRFVGKPELEIRLLSIEYRGERYRVDTSVDSEVGKSRTRQTAVRTGIGAAAGAIIGAIAGGGKGAAIGSLAGGGAGAGSDFFTHGPQVKIPAESILRFRLEAPLTVERR